MTMIKIDMVGVMMAIEMINNMMVREIMKILTSIVGWGVVPRMAPPPSQGVQR